MIKRFLFLVFTIITISFSANSQVYHRIRDSIKIPAPPGYITLKMDPHLHTVFSDGLVWPTVRVNEAWKEGLDAISLTEHIEYRRFSQDVVADHNRSYEIAKPLANQLDILLIQGAEISRSMPPGHFNAIFLHDANKLDVEDWRDAMLAARAQDAFMWWNHPGWDRQQPDTTLWFEEHSWLLYNDMLHGIEVYSGRTYYPEAHQWAIEKNLTMIGTTDLHNPIDTNYGDKRRPMTLIFANERSTEGIREALFAGRTAVYFDDKLIARKEYLDAVFKESLQVISVTRRKGFYGIELFNPTDIPIILSKARGNNTDFEFARTTIIAGGAYLNMPVYIHNALEYNQIELKFNIDNYLVAPREGLPVTMRFVPDNL